MVAACCECATDFRDGNGLSTGTGILMHAHIPGFF